MPPSGVREHERYEVEVRVDWSAGRMFVTDHVANIGKGGLCIRSETAIPVGAEVEMILWLPGRAPIRVIGRVVWSAEVDRAAGQLLSGSGLRFTYMHPTDRALLHEYLDELAKGRESTGGH